MGHFDSYIPTSKDNARINIERVKVFFILSTRTLILNLPYTAFTTLKLKACSLGLKHFYYSMHLKAASIVIA